VRPYEATMLAHCKADWTGRPLLDVLSNNYDRFPAEYWVRVASPSQAHATAQRRVQLHV
jgi:hypothetical protein